MNGKNDSKGIKWLKDAIYVGVLVIGLISSWLAQKYRVDNKIAVLEEKVAKVEKTLEDTNLELLQYQVTEINNKVDEFSKKFDTFIADYYRNR